MNRSEPLVQSVSGKIHVATCDRVVQDGSFRDRRSPSPTESCEPSRRQNSSSLWQNARRRDRRTSGNESPQHEQGPPPGDPRGRALLLVTATWWSWGESNPRPTLSLHAFSGRSLCRRSARLRPLSQTPKSTSPAWEESHVTSRRHHAARFLNDARIRTGITYGLTDYRARLCSEGEVVALGFGNYFFAESVYEITLHPRPASRGFTGAVETDQPRGPSLEGAAVTLWIFHTGNQKYPSITDYNVRGACAIPREAGPSRRVAP